MEKEIMKGRKSGQKTWHVYVYNFNVCQSVRSPLMYTSKFFFLQSRLQSLYREPNVYCKYSEIFFVSYAKCYDSIL